MLRSFDGIKQSAMHIYHSALSWTPTSSPTRQLYEHELMTEMKLVDAVGPTWDACIRIIPVVVGESVKTVVFSPSGALIATREGRCVKVFDVMTGVNRATFEEDKFISSVAFSPDDGFLVSGLWGGVIGVWDVQSGTMFRTFKWDMRCAACSVGFSPCGTMIASGNTDWTVRIWNILSGGCDCVFQGHSGIVTDVCWLATSSQVVSTSRDRTVCIWDVQQQTCSKILPQCHHPVVALASSQYLLLVALKNGTVNIHDSQSGDIIYIIGSSSYSVTRSRLSIDGGKVLVARMDSGDIWDITTSTLMHVGSISYNGKQATFSPDGTHVASIYGKFLKIWKTNTENHKHEDSTHVHDTIDGLYISPDEQLVTLKSKKGANILDVTTHQSLFTYPITNFLSIGFSLDLKFVAFLLPYGTVQTWNAHMPRLHNSITVDDNVFQIALSPDGSQLASLSPSHMALWDLKSKGCIAHLEFDRQLQDPVQILFSTNATSVTLLTNSNGMQCWLISPNHNIDLTKNSIKNGDSIKSWLNSGSLKSLVAQIWPHPYLNNTRDPIDNHDGTKLPMVFVPTMEGQSNLDVPASCQSYHCDTDDEWILDQDERHILWIPPDERPRKFLCFKHEKKVLVQTESGKVYFVNFL